MPPSGADKDETLADLENIPWLDKSASPNTQPSHNDKLTRIQQPAYKHNDNH
jgi:hypothetical protein